MPRLDLFAQREVFFNKPMKTFFEKTQYRLGKRETLESVRVRNAHAGGLVFVPPLIGGNFSQQIHAFRWLIRKGYDLLSFNYSGHGDSSDKFSLSATLRDTAFMLYHSIHFSREERLPLFGIASCYSAIPILHAVHCLGEPIRRLVLINGIHTLGPHAVAQSFFRYYRKAVIEKRRFLGVGGVARRYVDALFPGVAMGNGRFGVLDRNRTSFFRTITEFFALEPLKGIMLKRTPVLCLHSRRDAILDIYDAHLDQEYRQYIRQVCPRARFQSLDADHFLSQPSARGEAARSIASFFDVSS
jgi:hypothetical protein